MSDFFRDTWVRYLGYANEVGEAFRGVVPVAVVNASYKVAFGYVAADTIVKSLQIAVQEPNPFRILVVAGDALIWQTLASVIIPGFTINRICYFTGMMLSRHGGKMTKNVRSGLTVAAGLISIPIIVRPIDIGTTIFMNNTYRRIFRVTPSK